MLRIIKITGDSLSPRYQEGDFVVVTTIPFFLIPPRPGQVIVFQHPAYGRMIKEIDNVSPDGKRLFVVGSHPHSVDSRRFGPIPKNAVRAKVLWHIPKPRR